MNYKLTKYSLKPSSASHRQKTMNNNYVDLAGFENLLGLIANVYF